MGNKRSDITFGRTRCTLMEICSEYGFRAYDLRSITVTRSSQLSIHCYSRNEMERLLYYLAILLLLSPSLSPPLRFPIVARSTNGKIYRFYFWRASRVSLASGGGKRRRRGVCKYTYRKRGQAPDSKQSEKVYAKILASFFSFFFFYSRIIHQHPLFYQSPPSSIQLYTDYMKHRRNR